MAYGFEAYRANGSKLISSTDGVARLIFSQRIEDQWSGTLSVPAFDSDLGFWTITPYLTRFKRLSGVWSPVADTETWSQSGNPQPQLMGSRNPVVSWNNTTKIMTVTANTEPQKTIDGASSSDVMDRNPPTRIKFIHHR